MEASPTQVFSQRLREERARAGVSQMELAKQVSQSVGTRIDASAIARIESGERSVKLDEAVAMALALGVDFQAMLLQESQLELLLEEQREKLRVATEAFEAARKEMGRLQLVVLHLEELQGQGVREADIPEVTNFHVE